MNTHHLITPTIRRKAFIAATASKLVAARLAGVDVTIDCSAKDQGSIGKQTLQIDIHPDLHGYWFGALTVYQLSDAVRVLTMLWDGAHDYRAE